MILATCSRALPWAGMSRPLNHFDLKMSRINGVKRGRATLSIYNYGKAVKTPLFKPYIELFMGKKGIIQIW